MSLELTISTALIQLRSDSGVMGVVILSCRSRLFGAGLIVISLIAISIITGYQHWVVHFRITTMQGTLFRQIFDVTFPSRLNGGKIQLNCLPPVYLKNMYCFRLKFTRPGDIILKLCIYSGSKKINLWVDKLISNFNKYLRIKLPFCIIVNFSRKLVYFNILFSWYVSCRDK